jgi:hypothetical protein
MTSTLIAQLRNQLPSYTRRREHLARIQAELDRRMQAGSTRNPFASPERHELEALLEAGDPLEELDQRVAARLASEQAGAIAREALTAMHQMLKSEIAAVETSAHDVLPLLGRALADRVAEAKQLAPFEEIDTPEAASRSKRHRDADRLAELLAEIAELRGEQFRVLSAANFEWTSKASVLCAIRNPSDVFRDTAIWMRPGHLVHRRDRTRQQQVVAPWPWPMQTALTSIDLTRWALQVGAQLWIPTLAQYAAAAKELKADALQPRVDDDRHGDWADPGPERTTTQSRTSIRR